jgi:hypothetical protein
MAVTLEAADRHGLSRVLVAGRPVGYVQRRGGRYLPLAPDGRKLDRSSRSKKLAVAPLGGRWCRMTDPRIPTGPPEHQPAGPSHPSVTTTTKRGSLPAPPRRQAAGRLGGHRR